MTAERAVATPDDAWRRASQALGRLARSPAAQGLARLAARHPGYAVIALGSVGWLLGLVGPGGRSSTVAPASAPATPVETPVARAVVPPEYIVLATHLADGWQADRSEPGPGRDFATRVALIRNAALDLERLRPNDPDLAALATEAHGILRDLAAGTERLAALPRPPGQLDMMGESFLHGLVFDLPGASRQVNRLVGIEEDLQAETRRLVALILRAATAKLMLPRLAQRYAGPIRTTDPALAIDFDAAWGPVGPADWLTLTNRSGTDLHQATVLVEVRNATGEVAPSVHFVPAWPAGGVLLARYTPGDMVLDATIGRQTVPDVANVVVSLWAEELAQEGITYAYAGAERDADIARACAGMQILVHYQLFEPGRIWDTPRGLEVWLDGIATLPKPTITATFRRGARTKILSWSFPRWDRGERKVLRASESLDFDPEAVDIEVSFPRTKYKHVSRWTPN